MPRKPRPPKHGYHHGDLHRALLDAALKILEKEGAPALTLRAVAERVGVTKAAPYHHFADKEAILAALAEEGFSKLTAAMVEARDGAGAKPVEKLRAMGASYVHFAVKHPAHFQVMFAKMVDVPCYPSLHATADLAFATLVEAIAACQAAGAVRAGDVMELSLLAWSTVHGLATLWISGAVQAPPHGAPMSIEGLTEGLTRMLARGLG